MNPTHYVITIYLVYRNTFALPPVIITWRRMGPRHRYESYWIASLSFTNQKFIIIIKLCSKNFKPSAGKIS